MDRAAATVQTQTTHEYERDPLAIRGRGIFKTYINELKKWILQLIMIACWWGRCGIASIFSLRPRMEAISTKGHKSRRKGERKESCTETGRG